MSQATSIRKRIRTLLTKLGSTATVYSYDSATKTFNDEKEVTVSNWGTGTTFKAVSSNHFAVREIMGMQGEENNEADRILFTPDTVTIAQRDKVTVGTDIYRVVENKKIDPIQDTLLLQRVVLAVDARYG